MKIKERKVHVEKFITKQEMDYDVPYKSPSAPGTIFVMVRVMNRNSHSRAIMEFNQEYGMPVVHEYSGFIEERVFEKSYSGYTVTIHINP